MSNLTYKVTLRGLGLVNGLLNLRDVIVDAADTTEAWTLAGKRRVYGEYVTHVQVVRPSVAEFMDRAAA